MHQRLASRSEAAEPIDGSAIRLRRRDDYIIRTHVFADKAQPGNTTAGPLPSMVALLSLWRRRYVTRRHLRALDGPGLADVGIDPVVRDAEVAKHFWQA